jgi:hypothetical protein
MSRNFESNEDPLEGGCGSLVMKMYEKFIVILKIVGIFNDETKKTTFYFII